MAEEKVCAACGGELEAIGALEFSRSARHQPEPVRTEQSWVDGYLKGKP